MEDRTALSLAQEYLCRGWALITLPSGTKRPSTRGWQNQRATLEDVRRSADTGQGNLGVLTGEPSANLVRVDVDAPEVRRVAGLVLPTTGLVMGRGFVPGSGYFYALPDGLPASVTFKDPTGTGDEATLIDVLWTGKMSVVPPSVHPEGDTYAWESFGEATSYPTQVLIEGVGMAASAGLLGRHWPDGARHDAAMALAGGLLTDGYQTDLAEVLLKAVLIAAGDDEVADRLQAFYDTVNAIEQDKNVAGWPRLHDMVDPRVCRRVREWLGLNSKRVAQKSANATDLRTTDIGNSERLVESFGSELRYNKSAKKWHVWDGARWREDDTGMIGHRAVQVVKGMYAEAASLDTKDKRQVLTEWAITSEGIGRLTAMMTIAQWDRRVVVKPDDLDVDSWLLNTPSGTLDLKTARLADHDPNDMITMVTRGRFDPEVACPTWSKFVREAFNNDRELIDFMQRAAGYTLTGTTREQVALICWGDGANGKSTFLRSLVYALGDYGAWAPFDTFDAGAAHGVGNDLARLKGRRMVIAIEADSERVLSEARIKTITGGDRVACRFLYGEFFEYDPQYTIWLATNHKPIIRGTDHGMWRRILFIPFTQQFKGASDNKELREALEAEADGIFTWAVTGLTQYLARGLDPPASVLRATADYKAEMDLTSQFLEECCEVLDSGVTYTKELYARYVNWAKDYGEKALSHRSLSLELARRGFVKVKSNSAIRWRGLRLRPEVFRSAGMGDVALEGVESRGGVPI